jgi:hypothetical protein
MRVRDRLRTRILWKWGLGVVATTAVVVVGPALGATRLVPEGFGTIQAAIDASASGDTVLIGPGTYRGVGNREIEFRGRDVVVMSRLGAEATILDCEGLGRGFYLHEHETRAARIEGLTIVNGWADLAGGGILCNPSHPTIVRCRILGCDALQGGGLAILTCRGVVDQCFIAGNSARGPAGGGISYGGSLYGAPEVKNCVITGNTAVWEGAGVDFTGPGPNRLTGCTITGNVGGRFGGGLSASNPLFLERCIVWGNCSSSGGRDIYCIGADIRCCDIDPAGVFASGTLTYDEGCVFADPMFCQPVPCDLQQGGDWSLDASSPCLPINNPCGELIGALDVGCGTPTPTGACCFSNGSCLVLESTACADQDGIYMGDGTTCESHPCQPTPVQPTTWGRIKASYR